VTGVQTCALPIFPWLSNETNIILQQPPRHLPCDLICRTIESQLHIGINQLIRGRVSKKWEKLQTSNQIAQNKTTREYRWTEKFINSLWDLGTSLWAIRNKCIHTTKNSVIAKSTVWIHERVRYYYTYQQYLPTELSSTVFCKPVSERLLETDDSLIKWMQTVDIILAPNDNKQQNLSKYKYMHQLKTSDQIIICDRDKHEDDEAMKLAPNQSWTNRQRSKSNDSTSSTDTTSDSTEHSEVGNTIRDIIRKHSIWDSPEG